MVSITNLKAGKTFLEKGKLFKVNKYFHQKIARGSGTVKLTVRDLETGELKEKTFPSNAKVEEVTTIKRPLQYLYNDGSFATLMDPKTFDQIEIPLSIIEDELPYIKEGENVDVLFWDEKPLSIDIAAKVTLKITETVPGVKGNSATNLYKPATLENGLKVKVPLFVKVGDKIRIDTKSGEYVERAS